jgi:hypothetical protein
MNFATASFFFHIVFIMLLISELQALRSRYLFRTNKSGPSSLTAIQFWAGISSSLQPTEKVVVVAGGGAAGYFSAIECARILNSNKVPNKVRP